LLDSIEDEGSILISSALLETEARRVAYRNNISQDLVTMLIDKIQICDVTRVDFRRAGLLVATNGVRDVRSLDAIHLAVAESQLADVFITYDATQALAAQSLGMACK
jgi:predicted nucleic acid-binding protein